METLATLAMDVRVPKADEATTSLKAMKAAARGVEEQFTRTSAAQREAAIAQGLSGTAAGQAEKSMKALAAVYGQARDSLGRFAQEDGKYRTSQEATALMLIRNAQAQATLAKEQEKAAKETAALARQYDTLRASLDPFAAVQQTLAQRTKLLDDAMAKGVISAGQHADALSRATRAATSELLAVDNLNRGHAGAAVGSKNLTYAMLNLSRQASDLGVGFAGAATSGKPLQMVFMTLVQQTPQVVDVFAQLKAEGVSTKTALAQMVATVRGLIVTFAPWIAGTVAVGGAIWAVVSAVEAHEKRIKALHKAIDEQNKKLSESAPWLIQSADNAYLAAEGQKNFEKYLAKTNVTLAEQIKLMRLGAIEGLKKDLTDAQANQKKQQTEFDRIRTANGRGSSPMGFGTNVGAFSTVSAAPSRAAIEQTDKYKDALKEATKATDNVRIAQEKLNAALKVTPEDYGIFAGQASQAEKLAGALDDLLPKEKQIRDIRQQRAIVEQALAKGQISSAQAARAMAAADREIAQVNRDPAAERALKAAERRERAEAKKELAEITKAYEGPLKASEDYADALAKEISVMGMSGEQQKRREMAMQAAAAPTQALAKYIDGLRIQYEAQLDVMKAYETQQGAIKAQQAETIRTMNDAIGPTLHFSSALEVNAINLDYAARASRDLRFDIEDVAAAINNNDWTTAFAGLANVLLKVEAAFKQGATAADKFAAVAGVAQGIGSAVGGTGGAALSGAASGAMAGFTVGGPIGAAIGGVLGGLGGLLGSSSAKKRARQQEAAQRAAEEAQRLQTIANEKRSLEIALLEASGDALGAEAERHRDYIASLDESNRALAELVYQTEQKAKADAKAAAEQQTQIGLMRQLQAMDDAVLGTNVALLAQREEELAKLDPLSQTLQRLIWAREDEGKVIEANAKLAEEAAAAAAAAIEASIKAQNDILAIQAAASEKAAARVAEAQSQVAEVMSGLASASDRVSSALQDTMRSLADFADSLKAELGIGTTGGALDQAEKAFKAAVAAGNYAAIPQLGQAYASAAKEGAGSEAEYRRIVAQIRQASLNSVTSAKSDAYQQQLSYELMGAWFTNNRDAEMDVYRRRGLGLPGFANGGAFTIGGNPGVDQNVMSINGQDVARVGMGETVSVQPRGASNDNSEIAALRQQVAQLESRLGAALDKIAANTGRIDRNIDSVTEGGNAMLTEAAS